MNRQQQHGQASSPMLDGMVMMAGSTPSNQNGHNLSQNHPSSHVNFSSFFGGGGEVAPLSNQSIAPPATATAPATTAPNATSLGALAATYFPQQQQLQHLPPHLLSLALNALSAASGANNNAPAPAVVPSSSSSSSGNASNSAVTSSSTSTVSNYKYNYLQPTPIRTESRQTQQNESTTPASTGTAHMSSFALLANTFQQTAAGTNSATPNTQAVSSSGTGQHQLTVANTSAPNSECEKDKQSSTVATSGAACNHSPFALLSTGMTTFQVPTQSQTMGQYQDASKAEGSQAQAYSVPGNATTTITTTNGTWQTEEGSTNHPDPSTRKQRNQEYSRNSRSRKKARTQELTTSAQELTAIRFQEDETRRLAMVQLEDDHKAKREVLRKVLEWHAQYQPDRKAWGSVLADNVQLLQPVTPYRSFPLSEVTKESRISRGIDAVMNDAASISVMLERLGSSRPEWAKHKRENFLKLQSKYLEEKRQEQERQKQAQEEAASQARSAGETAAMVKLKLQAVETALRHPCRVPQNIASKGGIRHAFQTAPTSETAPKTEHTDAGVNHRAGEAHGGTGNLGNGCVRLQLAPAVPLPPFVGIGKHAKGQIAVKPPEKATQGPIVGDKVEETTHQTESKAADRLARAPIVPLPPFVGIGKRAPTSSPPPLSKTLSPLSNAPIERVSNEKDTSKMEARYVLEDDDILIMGRVLMCRFVFTTLNAVALGARSECACPGMLRAEFAEAFSAHEQQVNSESQMSDILEKSERPKLVSIELSYDAMGFVQQLGNACSVEACHSGGTEDRLATASKNQVIPGNLESALKSGTDARAITQAAPPFAILAVNEEWCRMTGYSQVDVEGKAYLGLLEGEGTVPGARDCANSPLHRLEQVASGRPACSTNMHYNKNKEGFIDFVCSLPLRNSGGEITALLHLHTELPP